MKRIKRIYFWVIVVSTASLPLFWWAAMNVRYEKTHEDRCWAQMSSWENLLNEYHEKNGRYPLDLNYSFPDGLTEAINTFQTTSHVTGLYIKDPWGEDFLYLSRGDSKFILGSAGSNKEMDSFAELSGYTTSQHWFPFPPQLDDLFLMRKY